MENQTENQTTVSFVSLGCFKNLVDTEVLGGMLEKRNIRIVSPYETSDWLIINTCGFVRDAKDESIDEILAALERKETGEINHVAVFGCLTQRYYKDLKKHFKEADVLWGVNDMEELADIIANTSKKEERQAKSQAKKTKTPATPYRDRELFLYSHQQTRIITTTPNVTFIKISEGCDMKCSFCSIPRIRGPFRSRTIDSILEEAENYKKMGFHEINLVSQNSTSFGRDRNGKSELPELLKSLSKLDFHGIRVLYLMPEEVNDDIIGAFNHPSIIPYFDLPFQHVSPALLKTMNRNGSPEKNTALVEKIRKQFKDAVIRSSFIVGFPGETPAQFEELLAFARDTGIERIGVFGYSPEEDTEAFKLKETVTPEVIEERKNQLMDVSDANLEAYNRKLVEAGARVSFLPLGPWDNNTTIGRIPSQCPDTDGLTRVDAPFEEDFSPYEIKITDFQHELLEGVKP